MSAELRGSAPTGPGQDPARSTGTEERVRAIIARHLGLAPERIRAESRLEDLGLDSLGALELVFQLEEEFQVAVPNERASEFTTVAAVCDGIETLLAVRAAAS